MHEKIGLLPITQSYPPCRDFAPYKKLVLPGIVFLKSPVASEGCVVGAELKWGNINLCSSSIKSRHLVYVTIYRK